MTDLVQRQLRHDLRQSLASVMVLGTVLDRRPPDDPWLRTYVRQLRDEVDWMSRLVDDTAPEVALVDLGATVHRVWESVSAASRCEMRFSRSGGLWVETDGVELARSVRNLLDNAVRAAGPDGVVEVTTDACGASVELTVADSGPGFGRVRAQQRLGLAWVTRYAQDNGGVVMVGTSEWGGALLRLVLPRAQAVEAAGVSS